MVECSPAVHKGLVPGAALRAVRRACITVPIGQVGREQAVLEEKEVGKNMIEDKYNPIL